MINAPSIKAIAKHPREKSKLVRIHGGAEPSMGLIFSLIWATTIATFYILIPWESMSGRPKFADLDNYVNAINLIASAQEIINSNGLVWLFSEPGWTLIMLLIGLFAQEPLEALQLISWLCAIAFLWFMHRRAGAALSLIIMFNPLVLDLVFSQVRSATALALLLIALVSTNRLIRLLLVIYACTVHSVSFILISLYFISVALEYSTTLRTRLYKGIFCIVISLILAWTLSYGREDLFTAIGDRRADYDIDSGSVLFVSFWMFCAMAIIAARKFFFKDAWHWSEGTVVMLFSLAFFMTLFSTNGVRFISLGLPLFACVLNSARPSTKTVTTFLLISYQAIQFVYWY